MIDNEEKIKIVIDKLNNIDFIIKSYIDHAELFSNKYSLEEVLPSYNAKKDALLEILEDLGGTWPDPLTNQI